MQNGQSQTHVSGGFPKPLQKRSLDIGPSLKIYDATIDDYRPATQQDIDLLWAISQAYGRLKRSFEQELDRVAQARHPLADR